MVQLFRKFGWRVAGGLDTQQGIESLCLLAMPIVRYALLANDVIVTTWASYADYQLTNSLLRSTVASLKSQARGQRKVRRVVQCQYCMAKTQHSLCSLTLAHFLTAPNAP